MDKKIERAILMIHNSYNRKLGLKDAAGESRLGLSRFCELFKSETGMTFKKYLKEKRLGEARKLLSSSSLGIKQISYQVGYKSPQSFSNDFKKRFTVSPSRYRKGKGS
jgi:two-component system response regulator YesN